MAESRSPKSRNPARKKISARQTSLASLASLVKKPSGGAWIELFPFGISVGSRHSRPVFVFKDKSGDHTLPVWLSPVDAGMAVADLSNHVQNAHAVSLKLLNAMKVSISRCEITEIVGHHQFAQLKIEGHPKMTHLRVRAEEAMSFCLAFQTRFFSTQAFMMQCREMDAEMMGIEQGLLRNPEIGFNKHLYMM
jgi:hypothetical protein